MSILPQIEAAIPALRRYARALLRDADRADDLVQDCLERAGGCVVALVQRVSAENICARIAETFMARHPELPSKVFVAETGDGLR